MKLIYPAFVNPVVNTEVRRNMSLNGTWSLRIDPGDRGAREGWSEGKEDFELSVDVPGTVMALEGLAEEYPSFINRNRYEGTCWYQRSIELDENWSGGRLWLKFGGVSPTAHLWLNGHYLGFHQHPIVGFKCDVTEYAVHNGLNVLTVELTRLSDLDSRKSISGGVYWGGPSLYCGVELEQTGDIRIEDLFIRPRIDEQEAWVTASIYNDNSEAIQVSPTVRVRSWNDDGFAQETSDDALTIEPGEVVDISIEVDMGGCKLWTPDSPNLYVLTLEAVSNGKVTDAVVERFGMRSMAVENKKLVLNHEPLFWRASSPELMRVPTISAMVDKDLIRRRIRAMKDMGFNGNRTHTHVYTREALDVCDEMGFILQVEPSVISNFHEISPYPENRNSLIGKVKEIRNHASVTVICMGNESSQIIGGGDYKERAKVHLEDIRDLVPDHLILTGIGYQGEYPDVYNAFQTPHLWSRSWKWSHGGLSAIPWAGLRHLTDEGPIVLHEYGKLTVWPDPAEDKFYRDANMPLRGNYGEMGIIALRDAGIEGLHANVLENSRKLSAACTKILFEEPRRQPGLQGYQYHCAMRVGANRGFIDDFGYRADPQFADLPLSNGDTALLIDRDFRNRAMTTGEPVELGVHLSHFGTMDIANGTLSWSLEIDGKPAESGSTCDLEFEHGKNALLQKIQFITPAGLGKFTLRIKLESDDNEVATNNWDFWRFPYPRRLLSEKVMSEAEDFRWEDDMIAHFPALRRVEDFLDAHFGLKCWKKSNEEKANALTSGRVKAIISDQWSDRVSSYVEAGGTAILFDRGSLPENWYVKAQVSADIAAGVQHDQYKRYVPFRTGWDHGNAATIMHDHPALGDFPHEGWCDLDCFDMIEGAATLKAEQLPGKVTPIIRVIPVWRSNYSGAQEGPSPSIGDVKQLWFSEERCYLAESKIGRGRLIVCSLKLLNNTAGRYLLERLIGYVESI